MNAKETIIEFRDFSFQYLSQKEPTLHDINLTVHKGEKVLIAGPSGCGKTTTLRMIAGLESPTEGRITIGDQVVFDADEGINVSPAKRDIGFLFQNYALWPNMTVHDNIAFGLENIKENLPNVYDDAKAAMEAVVESGAFEGIIAPVKAVLYESNSTVIYEA